MSDLILRGGTLVTPAAPTAPGPPGAPTEIDARRLHLTSSGFDPVAHDVPAALAAGHAPVERRRRPHV